MKNIYLLILLIVNVLNLSAQNYIIAGKVSSKDSLYINNLSVSVTTAYPPYYDSLDIDLNKDNLNDIRIISFASYGSGYQNCYGQLKSITNNAFYSFDNGSGEFSYLVKKFGLGDTIGKALQWTHNEGCLASWTRFPSGETWINGEWNNQQGYAGLMIILNSDTIYGWIHMLVQNNGKDVQIDSCAFQKKDTLSLNHNNLELLLIYPNPAKDIITIEIQQNSKENTLTIFNINGQRLIEKTIIDNKTLVDISNLSRGVYFVKLVTGKTVEVRKIIKE